MRVTQSFIDDMRYLKVYYEWTDADVKEVKAAIKDSPEMVRYFTILAAAHRAGYEQHAGNGFVRLKDWCLANGLDDPYGDSFDPVALDSIQAKTRAL